MRRSEMYEAGDPATDANDLDKRVRGAVVGNLSTDPV